MDLSQLFGMNQDPMMVLAQMSQGVRPQVDPGYEMWLRKYKVQNPNDPRHNYDYRKAYESGIEPKLWDELPEKDKEEDIKQAVMGLRWGRPMSREEAIKAYSGHYMFPDIGKLPTHPIRSKEQ